MASVREYIAAQPKASRASLGRAMPAYTLNGVGVLYFGGWNAHYSLYPVSDALVVEFAKELAPFERGKRTIKFLLSEPVPVRLITRIARFRAQQVSAQHGTGAKRQIGSPPQP